MMLNIISLLLLFNLTTFVMTINDRQYQGENKSFCYYEFYNKIINSSFNFFAKLLLKIILLICFMWFMPILLISKIKENKKEKED